MKKINFTKYKDLITKLKNKRDAHLNKLKNFFKFKKIKKPSFKTSKIKDKLKNLFKFKKTSLPKIKKPSFQISKIKTPKLDLAVIKENVYNKLSVSYKSLSTSLKPLSNYFVSFPEYKTKLIRNYQVSFAFANKKINILSVKFVLLLFLMLAFLGATLGVGLSYATNKDKTKEINRPVHLTPISIYRPRTINLAQTLLYPPPPNPTAPKTDYVRMEDHFFGTERYFRYYNGTSKTIQLSAGTSSSDYIDINSKIIITFYNSSKAKYTSVRFSPKYALFGLRKLTTKGQRKISVYDYYSL